MARRAWAALALLAALVLSAPAASCAASIRGLGPALAQRYQPVDGKFACLDGLKTIPFEQVNDDYCDCFDGSDEPGTSACANGHFYCANKFFLPLRLNSSMVDDGVCDCCDGSDEPAGRCKDTCYDKGMAGLADLSEKVRTAEAGAAARAKYSADAAGTKAQWEERKAVVEAELVAKRAEQEAAEAEKKKLDDEKQALEDSRKALEDEQTKLQEEQEAAAAGAGGGEEGAQPDGGADGADDGAGGGGVEEPLEQAGEEGDGGVGAEPDGEADEAAALAAEAAEAAAAEMAEAEAVLAAAEAEAAGAGKADATQGTKTEEDLAKERMAQWIPNADRQTGEELEGVEEQPEEAPTDDPDQFFRADGGSGGGAGGGNGGDGGGDRAAEEVEEGAEGGAAAAGAVEQQPTTALGKAQLLLSKLLGALWGGSARGKGSAGSTRAATSLDADIAALDAKLAALEKKLAPVRTRASDVRSSVQGLESEAADLAKKLGGSYGAGDVFVALVDRCFEAKVDKYTYEVCPFGKASQKEGHSTTSLGTWQGLLENDTVMAFRNGQGCWQGPARSMTVSLKCGKKERLAHVDEPSRCEYSAELETPAACTAEAAAALAAELRARQQFLGGEAEVEDTAAAAAAGGAARDEL